MNYNKLPAHRRATLLLKWWLEDTRDFPRFEHKLCPDYDPNFRLDDNNTETPSK